MTRFAPRRVLFLADFRPVLLPEEALRADFLLLFLADFLAERLVDFLADLLADFLADLLPDFLADFRAPPFLAVFLRGRAVRVRLAGSSPSSNDDCEDVGDEEGVFSIGSGSIHPEPDQPISRL